MQASNKTLEILAPAGSMEALQAAVRSGADAVYLGASQFSARGNAKNFDRAQLREAVEYCHLAGVAVHLAVNILTFESEFPAALELVQYACTLPVDAIIVQDWGLFSLLRQAAPTLPLHASTQMSIHTPAGARLLAEQGASRVVLSRELSLSEIRAIADTTSVELEHFVHGALCMCVSGQCYFSAMLGSRSGNRGLCAQPCRLPFRAEGGTGHDLSLKDLSMISRLDALREAGVDACKIEGRMKRPEYVAAAVSASYHAANGIPQPPELLQQLEAVFSRSGFTSGYPDGNLGVEMFGTRTHEDVTGATKSVFSALQQRYQKERQAIPLSMRLTVSTTQPTALTVSDGTHTVAVKGAPAEVAQTRPLDPTRCESQLKKTGGTVFTVTDYAAELPSDAALPISALNELRRHALSELSALRQHKPAIPFSMPHWNPPKHVPHPFALRAQFSRVLKADFLPEEVKHCELVFVPLCTEPKVLEQLLARNIPLGVSLPRAMFGKEPLLRKKIQQAAALGIQHGWTGNIGGIPLLQEAGIQVHGGFSLNVGNSASTAFLAQLGVTDTELSCELTLAQASAIGGTLPRGMVVYGHLPLMLTRNCPAANHPDGCRGCVWKGGRRPAQLTDRKGVVFPVQCEWGGAAAQVLNSIPMEWSDQLDRFAAMDFGMLQFTVENSVEIGETLARYFQKAAPKGSFTRGLYRRGVE